MEAAVAGLLILVAILIAVLYLVIPDYRRTFVELVGLRRQQAAADAKVGHLKARLEEAEAKEVSLRQRLHEAHKRNETTAADMGLLCEALAAELRKRQYEVNP